MPTLTFEVQTEIEGEFEVFCARCGAGLCLNCSIGRSPGRGMPYIQVEPCERCTEDAKDEGYEKALKEDDNGST